MRSIVNFDPWREIDRMWDMFERRPSTQSNLPSTGINVPLDVYEQDDRLMVRASLPGVKAEDIDVSIDKGLLTISGETRNDYENREGSRVVHREHSYGSFVRSVRLPEDIDENGIDAQFENGVLTIAIRQVKTPETRPKQIPIRNASTPSQPIGNQNFAYADQGRSDSPKQAPKEPAKGK